MPGNIKNPKVVWSLDTSASKMYFVVNADEPGWRSCTFELADVPEWNRENEEYWGLRPAKLDVSGNGTLHDVSETIFFDVWGKFLPEVPGYQKICFTNTWTGPGQANLQMLSYENGIEKPRTVWDVKFEPLAEAPMLIVVDVDGDGQLEVAVSHWYGVTIYDLYTGATKYQNIYRGGDHGRQYGHFSVVKFPDGKVALLVVGDFSPHISVLMVRDGKLEVLWYLTFENDRNQGIDRRVTINRVCPEPADDYDGDGQVEVMMNFFNSAGDNHWHLIGYDALNGRVKYDVEDFYLDGTVDVDGDGRKEWVGRCYDGRALNTYAPLLILKPTGEGQTREIWSLPRGRWSLRQILPRLTVRTFQPTSSRMSEPVSHGYEQGTEAILFFSEPVTGKNSEKLSALKFDFGKPVILWAVEGSSDSRLDALSVRDEGVLVRLEQPLNSIVEMHAKNASIEAISRGCLVYFAPQPLVLKDNNKTHIIVATSAQQICCFQSQGQREPKMLWTHPGRPMTTNRSSRDSWFGLEASDIDGDGVSEVLYVTENPEGGARILARDLGGTIRWQYDFPEFCGYVAEWGDCMTTFWALGHFIRNDSYDVFVSHRRSIMHSDESVIIDKQKNSVVWRKDTLEVREPWTSATQHTRGYGGGLPALADFNDDCLDDIVLTYPCELSIVKGKDGSQLFVENMGPVAGTRPINSTDQSGFWLIGSNLLVADLDGDGMKESLVTHPGMVIVFKHRDQRSWMVWRTEPGDGVTSLPALADTNGDGFLVIGLPGCRDGFRCVDPKTGEVLWKIAGGASSNCLACDIDGDGREEFLYADGKLIRAVRNGNVTWEVNLLAVITQLAAADVDGDGTSEILVCAENGKIYCIDGSSWRINNFLGS